MMALNLVINVVLIFTTICSISWAKAPPFSREEFESNLIARLTRVEEFEKIKKLAEQKNMKIILARDAFSSYANYVFWDLNRLCMLKKFSNEQFKAQEPRYFEQWIANEQYDDEADLHCDNNDEYESPQEYVFNRSLEYDYTIDDIYYPMDAIYLWYEGDKTALRAVLKKFNHQTIRADGSTSSKFSIQSLKKFLKSDTKKLLQDNWSQSGLGFDGTFFDCCRRKFHEKPNTAVKAIYERKLRLQKTTHKSRKPQIFELVRMIRMAGQYNVDLPKRMTERRRIYGNIICDELGKTPADGRTCKGKLKDILANATYRQWLRNNLLSALTNSVDNVKTRSDIKNSGLEILFLSFNGSLQSQVSGEKKVCLSIAQLYSKQPFLAQQKKLSREGKSKFLVHRTPNVVNWHNVRKAYDGRGNFFITRSNTDIEVAGTGAGVYFSEQQSYAYGPYCIMIELYKDSNLVVGNYFDSLKEYCLKDRAPIIRVMRQKDIAAWTETNTFNNHKSLSDSEYIHDLLLIHGLTKKAPNADDEIKYREELFKRGEACSVAALKELTSANISYPSDEYLKKLNIMYYNCVENTLQRNNSINTVIKAYELQTMPTVELGIKLRDQIVSAGHVKDWNDLTRLSKPLVNNPSNEYKAALRKFYLRHLPTCLPKTISFDVVLNAHRYLLQTTSSVEEGIVLRKGIISRNYVKTVDDLYQLSATFFDNPTEEYKKALRNFYVSHLPDLLDASFGFHKILAAYHLERSLTVEEGIKSRQHIIDLGVVKSEKDLSLLVQPKVSNPHPAYSVALNNFFARHVSQLSNDTKNDVARR